MVIAINVQSNDPITGLPRNNSRKWRDGQEHRVYEKDRCHSCFEHGGTTCACESCKIPPAWHLLLWFPCRRSSHVQHQQVLWKDNRFHRRGHQPERLGGSQLCHGLVQIRYYVNDIGEPEVRNLDCDCFSATVVAAYLMMKKGMTSSEALETIRQSRPIRPNPGFLQQLADHENLLNKKPFW